MTADKIRRDFWKLASFSWGSLISKAFKRKNMKVFLIFEKPPIVFPSKVIVKLKLTTGILCHIFTLSKVIV